MDRIPFEEQRVIDELIVLYQTGYEPSELVIHMDRLSGSWGSGIGSSFFRQVYEDLRKGKLSRYDTFSKSDFKRFLEAEFSQQAHEHAMRQAQAQAKADAERQAQAQAKLLEREEYERRAKAEREENERRAKANFDALGHEMANATTRAELVELGRKRADLAPHTGVIYVYKNHCWKCKAHISSAIHARCPGCKFYICSSCGSCLC